MSPSFKSKPASKINIPIALLSFLFYTTSGICMESFETSSTIVATHSSAIATPPSPTKKAPIKRKQETTTALEAFTPPTSKNTYSANNKYTSLSLTDESNNCLDKIKIGGIESLLAEKIGIDTDKNNKLSQIKKCIEEQPAQVCNLTDFPYHKIDSHVTVSEIDILNKEHADFLADFNEGIKEGAYSIKIGEIKILTSFIGILMDLEINEKFYNISKYSNALSFFTNNNKSKKDNPLILHISLIHYCCNMYKDNTPQNCDKKNMEKHMKSVTFLKTKIGIAINNFIKIDCVQEYEHYIKNKFETSLINCQTVESACTSLDSLKVLNQNSDLLFLNGLKYKDSDYYKKLNTYLTFIDDKNYKNFFNLLKKKENFIFINNFNELKSSFTTLVDPYDTAYTKQIEIQQFIKKTPEFEDYLKTSDNASKFKILMETPPHPTQCVLEHSILPNSDYVYELVEHLNKSKDKLSDIKIEPKELSTSSLNS